MVALAAAFAMLWADPLPVRGLHMLAPGPNEVARTAAFIREVLPKEGVNTLILEVDTSFKYRTHPEVVEKNAISEKDAKELVAACRDAHIRLIPEFDLLGHQSWDKNTAGFLRAHPEFDETRGKYPENKGIYSRSYCPRAPGIHKVIFDMINELAAAFEADAFHVGMDEVFILGDKACPRCRGRDKAKLFSDEVNTVHGYLAKKHLQMWMWGDRLLPGKTTGLGDWQASGNDTDKSIKDIPRDIVICDWHYEKAEPTAIYFAMQGFQVVASTYYKPDVTLATLELIQNVRGNANEVLAGRMLGVVHTVWRDAGAFIDAYEEKPNLPPYAKDSADTFKVLFGALRK